MSRVQIEENPEPEIQYAATPELFQEIHDWLSRRGQNIHKTSETPSQEVATYYDTRNYRLLREGVEYRVKHKGKNFRHDMKTPNDPKHSREVLPDRNNILWRRELKFKTDKEKPSLMAFWGQALLMPIRERLKKNFFQKELYPQFQSIFSKEKIDHIADSGDRVEYSFQTGRMQTMDGSRSTPLMHILEIELREGDLTGLLAEKALLESVFVPRGLKLLPVRKVFMGFELLLPDMAPKQQASFRDARVRNCPAYLSALEDAGFSQKLVA